MMVTTTPVLKHYVIVTILFYFRLGAVHDGENNALFSCTKTVPCRNTVSYTQNVPCPKTVTFLKLAFRNAILNILL
jgi:hypothetical protein